MIQFFFDTNICIDLIRLKRAAPILAHMERHPPDSFAISAITLAELQFGVDYSSDPVRNLQLLMHFLTTFPVLPFTQRATVEYGPLRAQLESAGKSIGPLDTLIAAHAVSLNLTLITGNEREFRRVPRLKVENWTKA